MPGCNGKQSFSHFYDFIWIFPFQIGNIWMCPSIYLGAGCDHAIAANYFAESINSDALWGRRCADIAQMNGEKSFGFNKFIFVKIKIH